MASIGVDSCYLSLRVCFEPRFNLMFVEIWLSVFPRIFCVPCIAVADQVPAHADATASRHTLHSNVSRRNTTLIYSDFECFAFCLLVLVH